MSAIFLQANKVLLFSFLLCFLPVTLVLYKLVSRASLKIFPTKQAWQRKARKEDAACLSEDFIFWWGWKFTEDDEWFGVMLHFQLSAIFFKTYI